MKLVNFKTAFVASGKKARNEATPQLSLSSSYSGFKLNDRGMAELGADVGEYVVMFDAFDPNAPVSQEERYLICRGGFENEDGNQQGAILGKTRGFSYSYIYGTMLLQDPEVQSVGVAGLMDAGKVVETENGSKVATQTITWDLVPYNGGELVEIAEGVERQVFQLTNPTVKEHNPRSFGSEEEEMDNVEVED